MANQRITCIKNCNQLSSTKITDSSKLTTIRKPKSSHLAQRSSQSSDPSMSNAITSLKGLYDSMPENPHIYYFSEICQATIHFLAKRKSSSSSLALSWRSSLRGKDMIVFQRKLRTSLEIERLWQRLAIIWCSLQMSVIKLLGASTSGDHIFLVYDFFNGSKLADSLRNPKNINVTVLSIWVLRMQIATDLAHVLDYIHNNTELRLTSP